MSEKEIVEVFVRVQEPEYYDRIMLLVGAKFAEIVKVGETIEDGLRTGKIARVAASPGSSGLIKKKREDVSSISYEGKKTPRKSLLYQGCSRPSQNSYTAYHAQADYQNTLPPSYQNTPPPCYQISPPIYQTPPPVYQTSPHHYRNVAPSCANKKPAKIFTPLVESRTKLFERLNAVGYIHPVGPKSVDTNSKFYKPDQRCAYHSNNVGHDTEDCINLKHKIQDLIDQKVVSLQTVEPNVNSNPLPNHGGVTINMIETDEDWCMTKAIVPITHDNLERAVALLSIKEKKEFVILTPEKVVALVPRETLARPKFVIETAVTQAIPMSAEEEAAKRPISEAEAEEFWRKMQPKDYSIVKHLEKTPAQISVWVLLMSSQMHRQALMKALDDSYVLVDTNSDNLATMINQVILGHRISFCDEELPFEGRMHNKALHVTIMCRDKIINRVLIDDGSGLNICPLSTLRQLKFDLGKLHQNQVNVRVFDGVQRNTLDTVNLDIQMGPAEFKVEFQVLDINTSYNLLLGRPFIHMAGAVPSTLHQLMKFVWKHQELVIYGEGSHSNRYAPIVDDVSRGCDFYTVELVNATGDDLAPQPPMPSVYKMIATVMLWSGFKPGFGLGKHFQGITEPIRIPVKEAKFEYVNDDGLEEGIWGHFEEIDAVVEEEARTSGTSFIKICLLICLYFTFLIWFVYDFSNINLKPANVMSCHELNERNKVGDDECEVYEDENEVPEHVAEEFRQFENQHKPNLEEIETVNLGDEECIKEVRISVYLTETQRRDTVHLLREYIDVFAWSYKDMPGLSTNMVSHKLPINPVDPMREDSEVQARVKFKDQREDYQTD
ncbi:hypothetical protein R3W88_012421 [Solanum pinnatisectum]|uniref:G-patch domain-containing protein n=1 Tax=Solanum pinnatisectum TaxID=50273 RepID=A0AAV9LAC6_9SOLN|nr:hypothetical protein R3W88_012421 [Solanum pinnatisectum]